MLRRLQLLAIVGIDFFQDVLSLEPGDRFERRIEAGIDRCDLFLLFWSSEAKRSEWVRKEVQLALSRNAGNELSPPEIRPVIVEGPPTVEPWDELAHLHFNDRMLHFMNPRIVPDVADRAMRPDLGVRACENCGFSKSPTTTSASDAPTTSGGETDRPY